MFYLPMKFYHIPLGQKLVLSLGAQGLLHSAVFKFCALLISASEMLSGPHLLLEGLAQVRHWSRPHIAVLKSPDELALRFRSPKSTLNLTPIHIPQSPSESADGR